jgi:hypothetical protein
MPGVRWLLRSEPSTRARLRARAAIAGALAHDDRVAPILRPLDSAIKAGQAIPLDGRIRLKLTDQRPADAMAVASAVLALLGVSLGLSIYVVRSGRDAILSESMSVVLSGVTAVLLLLSVVSAFAWYRWSRPVGVHVDGMGIEWRAPGLRRRLNRIAWHEAQSFIVASEFGAATWPISGFSIHQAYALIAPDVTFSWQIKNPTDAELQTSQALIELIFLQTRLPLRDVTTALDRKLWRPELNRKKAEVPDEGGASLSAYLPFGMRHQRARIWLLAVLVSLLLVQVFVPFLLWPASSWLQDRQRQYYSTLSAQVHLHEPLFADDLSTSRNIWPEERNNQFGESYFYQDGAYHMTGRDPDRLMYAWATEMMADVAVEVTAAQIGTAENDGVGLLLRRDYSDSNRVVYQVSPSGFWSLWRYYSPDDSSNDWHIMDAGTSAAIHTGSGAKNHPLVIMKGSLYLCYINDQFVASVYDQKASPRGHMGVYMNTSVTEGVFTDFAVYPAPEIKWPW